VGRVIFLKVFSIHVVMVVTITRLRPIVYAVMNSILKIRDIVRAGGIVGHVTKYMRKISSTGLDLLKKLEGLKLIAYLDQRARLTIGFGHTGSDVTPGLVITEDHANELLEADISTAEHGVGNLVKRPLTDNQYSALVIFTYNEGVGHFKLSTMLTLLNNYTDLNTVAKEFAKWNKVEDPKTGQLIVSQGLVNRRAQEAKLFLTADPQQELTSPTPQTGPSIQS
jgi:lysozyme